MSRFVYLPIETLTRVTVQVFKVNYDTMKVECNGYLEKRSYGQNLVILESKVS